MAGVTSLILCLSAFTSDLSEETTKKALESTTINDIKRWSLNLISKNRFSEKKRGFFILKKLGNNIFERIYSPGLSLYYIGFKII